MKRKIGILICSLFLFTACHKTKHKNVVFILADDFGYHDMTNSGSQYYETPNLDKLSKESMVFTDGYASCQVCSPSRASIMSGKNPARHGITDWIGAESGENWGEQKKHVNKFLPAEYVRSLPTNYITLPEAMKENGYTTFFAGKWHLGGKGSWPEDHGFDINIGGWDSGNPKGGYFSPYKNPNLKDGKDGENLSMRLAKETSTFIRENQDRPFFAYLSFYAVHSPLQTTQKKWAKYKDKAYEMGIAEIGFEMGKYSPIKQTQDNPVYAGLVESMDDAIGEVMATLDELGLDENTIVVFTSDNGGVVAAAGNNAFATSNLPFKAGKGYQFEGGIREPYFIKVPWMKNGGNQCNAPVIGTDFYPTILDLVGAELKPEQHQDGISLLPLLKGEKIAERPLIWHYPHYGNQGGEPSSIIRKGDWKMIHYHEDGRKELYNLKEDISETTDRAKEHSEIVDQLNKSLFDYLNEVRARFPRKDPLYDEDKEREHLDWVKNERMNILESKRRNMLSNDFSPNNNWWGSIETID